ncbi:MAG: DegV family protein [Dehalococcoidia bacterium]|jgi:DegV family protein with EDD domain
MTVRIITDSTSDMPTEVAKELGITVVPLYVRFGEEVYRDGIELTTDQFYPKMVASEVIPTTSVPAPADFVKEYDRLAEEADGILVLTISRKLSATYDSAKQAIEERKSKCPIELLDSRLSLMGLGLIAVAAAKAANQGANLEELVALTKENIPRLDMRIAFDTLEYLRRGGRIGKAQAFFGSLLKVNPILTIKDGEVYPAARERSRAKAVDYLVNFAGGYKNIEEMAVEDATTPDEADSLVERLGAKYPKEDIYRSKVSPVIGAHVGPRVLSVIVLGEVV